MIMKLRTPGLLVLLALFSCPAFPVFAQGNASLDEILTNMDRRGAELHSMSCRISQKKWTDLLEEFDQGETGRFYFLKKNGKVYLRKEISQPQENILVVNEGQVTFYQPKLKQAQRYNLGQNKDKAEFLILGFGSNKQALKDTYKIRLLGRATVRNRDCYELELTPKSEKVSAFFPQIVLWVDSSLWVPIRQKLVEATKDYLLIDFDDIQLNAPVPESLFTLKLPRGVEIVALGG
jgi:outer membrane lipoprotein-sorting protein